MKKYAFLLLCLMLLALSLTACAHEHAYDDWTEIKAASCTEEGMAERACTCSDRIPKMIPARGHSFAAATCTSPRVCTDCGATEGEPIAHAFADATCTVPMTCNVCGATEGEPIAHVFADATCTAPMTCTVCDTTKGTPNAHRFPGELSNLCIDIACLDCDAVKAQSHSYETVTATVPTLNKTGLLSEKCAVCGDEQITFLPAVDPHTLGMPIICISDYDAKAIPLAELEKSDGEITVQYRYISNRDDTDSFDCFCEIKIQGSSSAGYPKKNFTVKLYKDASLDSKLKVDLGWGKESKYCMKANYIDASQARNIVGAKLFAQMVQSRDAVAEGLTAAPNFGVIDGYPVLVYLNGEFYGLYTMNIPKDEWMLGMEGGEEDREAMLMSDGWTDANQLKAEIGESFEDSGFEVEYCSTEEEEWIRESFNELIVLLNCGDGERIKQELSNHLDVDAAIDNMLFTYFINAADNVAKNVLWVTYDGKVWIPTMYDMDGTFGIFWNGQPIGTTSPREAYSTYPSITAEGELDVPGMILYRTLITCFADRVQARWSALRQSVLSMENVTAVFDAFFAQIPEIVYTSDHENWTRIPYYNQNRHSMYVATAEHLALLDAFFYHFTEVV